MVPEMIQKLNSTQLLRIFLTLWVNLLSSGYTYFSKLTKLLSSRDTDELGSVWFRRWLWLLYWDTDLKDWTDLWDGDFLLGIPFELVIISIVDGSNDVDALLLSMKLSLSVKFCLWLTPVILERTCSECWYWCKPDNADLKYINHLGIR